MVGFMKSALNLFGIKKDTSTGAAAGLDEFLSGLPDQLGYDVRFTKTEKEGGLYYEVEGSEVDSFIGNSSEVLDALSHLAMRVQRKTEGLSNEPVSEESKESYRIVFDAQGFREKKSQELRDMAAEKRKHVMDSGGKPAYVPALSPSDRKVIHTALADLGDVVSESIGKGNFKRIRIRLKDETKRTYVPKPNEGGEVRAQGQGNGNGNGGGGRGPRGNGGGGRGRGPGNGPRGNGGGGRGPRGNNGGGRFQNDRHQGNGMEVNGNLAQPPMMEEEHVMDENIGNRLRPGENPAFKYGDSNFGNSDKS